MTRIDVEIGSREFVCPSECPCCGAPPDGELEIPLKPSTRKRAVDSAERLLFPYCRRCLEHVAVSDSSASVSAVFVLFGIIGGVVAGIWSRPLTGLLGFGIAMMLAIIVSSILQSRARELCTESCACPDRAVTYLGWSGYASAFAFASAAYTARFAEENLASLVGVDLGLRRLLEAHKAARVKVPTPGNALRVVSAPRSPAEWIEQLDRQSTRIGRRLALVRALRNLEDEEDRRRVVERVVEAEMRILAGDLERLPIKTKRRRLGRVIEEVRCDNLPDVLREALLRELARVRDSRDRPTQNASLDL